MTKSLSSQASKLLEALAEQETEKRHQDTSDMSQVSNSGIMVWLRGLAPLTDEQLYSSAWVD